jgi:excisionase family DNA binding protein
MMAELKDERAEGVDAAMLTVHDVARMLNCSARTIYRLTDSGKMPRPVKLNALVRWRREVVENWINQGCPRAKDMEVLV